MPKYDTTSQEERANGKVSGKESTVEPRFNERTIIIVDVGSEPPSRYEFIYQNDRIVGIRRDEYDTQNEEWNEDGVSAPHEPPERVLVELEKHTGKRTWVNEVDIERCENYSRKAKVIEDRE